MSASSFNNKVSGALNISDSGDPADVLYNKDEMETDCRQETNPATMSASSFNNKVSGALNISDSGDPADQSGHPFRNPKLIASRKSKHVNEEDTSNGISPVKKHRSLLGLRVRSMPSLAQERNSTSVVTSPLSISKADYFCKQRTVSSQTNISKNVNRRVNFDTKNLMDTHINTSITTPQSTPYKTSQDIRRKLQRSISDGLITQGRGQHIRDIIREFPIHDRFSNKSHKDNSENIQASKPSQTPTKPNQTLQYNEREMDIFTAEQEFEKTVQKRKLASDTLGWETPPGEQKSDIKETLTPPSVKKLLQQFESASSSISYNDNDEKTFDGSPNKISKPLILAVHRKISKTLLHGSREYPSETLVNGVASEPRNNTYSILTSARPRADSEPNRQMSRRNSVRLIPAIVRKIRMKFETQEECTETSSPSLRRTSQLKEGHEKTRCMKDAHEIKAVVKEREVLVKLRQEATITVPQTERDTSRNQVYPNQFEGQSQESSNEVIKSERTDWITEICRDPNTPSVRNLKKQYEKIVYPYAITSTVKRKVCFKKQGCIQGEHGFDTEGQISEIMTSKVIDYASNEEATPIPSVNILLKQFETLSPDQNLEKIFQASNDGDTTTSIGMVQRRRPRTMTKSVIHDDLSHEDNVVDHQQGTLPPVKNVCLREEPSSDIGEKLIERGNVGETHGCNGDTMREHRNTGKSREKVTQELDMADGEKVERETLESKKLANDYREKEILKPERREKTEQKSTGLEKAGSDETTWGEAEKSQIEMKKDPNGLEMEERDREKKEENCLDIEGLSAELLKEQNVGKLIYKFTLIQTSEADSKKRKDSVRTEDSKKSIDHSDYKVGHLIEKFVQSKDIDLEVDCLAVPRNTFNEGRRESDVALLIEKFKNVNKRRHSSSEGGSTALETKSSKEGNFQHLNDDELYSLRREEIAADDENQNLEDTADIGKKKVRLGRRDSDVAQLIDKFTYINRRRNSSSSSYGSGEESSGPSSKNCKEAASIPTVSNKNQGKVRQLNVDELRFFNEGGSALEKFVSGQRLCLKEDESPDASAPLMRSQSLRLKKGAPPRLCFRGGSMRLKKSESNPLPHSPARAIPNSCRELHTDEVQYFSCNFNHIYPGIKENENQTPTNSTHDLSQNVEDHGILSDDDNHSLNYDSDSESSILRGYDRGEKSADETLMVPAGDTDLNFLPYCEDTDNRNDKGRHLNFSSIYSELLDETIKVPNKDIELLMNLEPDEPVQDQEFCTEYEEIDGNNNATECQSDTGKHNFHEEILQGMFSVNFMTSTPVNINRREKGKYKGNTYRTKNIQMNTKVPGFGESANKESDYKDTHNGIGFLETTTLTMNEKVGRCLTPTLLKLNEDPLNLEGNTKGLIYVKSADFINYIPTTTDKSRVFTCPQASLLSTTRTQSHPLSQETEGTESANIKTEGIIDVACTEDDDDLEEQNATEYCSFVLQKSMDSIPDQGRLASCFLVAALSLVMYFSLWLSFAGDSVSSMAGF